MLASIANEWQTAGKRKQPCGHVLGVAHSAYQCPYQCARTHLPPQGGMLYVLGQAGKGSTKGGITKPIIWREHPALQPDGTWNHFIYSKAKKVNDWPVVDDWKEEMHWSGTLIYQVAGALGVPYMRVACLQQILKEAEVRGKEAAEQRSAATIWLEKHWRKWTALQGTSLFRRGPWRSAAHVQKS